MNKLVELIDQLAASMAAINAQQAGIETEAEKNAGGLMSADQKAAYDGLSTKYDEEKAKHTAAVAQFNEQKARQSRNPVSPVQKPKTAPNSVSISNPTPAAAEDPKKGFKTPREFLSAVMAAGLSGELDERLHLCKSMAAGADEQSTFSNPYGNFLIPTGFSPNLMSLMAEADPIGGLVTQIPMESAVVDIPARVDENHTSSVSGGLRVYRRAEGDTTNSSRMEIEQVQLRATSLFGVAYATEELLSRSPMSFVALLESGFRDEFGAKLIDERLNGTGVGMMEGVINSPCVVSVAKETGQAAATINKENIDKMRSRCWGYGRAVWLYNHDCLPQLRSLVQEVGVGGAAVPYFSVDANGNSTLDGRPAYATEFTQTLGTVGDLVLGNWSQYLEGTLTGMSNAESVHVRFLNHERTFKFWMENDGRCWWRSALTPKRSSSTLSPFVTLATRS